jgi:hypothetical protein
MMKDRGSEVLYTLHQPIKSDIWADLSATLTGDQNQRALFRVASPIRGKLEHSQGCRKLFRKADLVPEQATHLPMEMSIRITASLAPPGFHDHFQITRIRSFSRSPWSGPLKDRDMSVRLHNADKVSLTITTRIQPYLARQTSCQLPHAYNTVCHRIH